MFSVGAFAQITVNGTEPANNSTNVPSSTVVKIWFSAPLDTTKTFEQFRGFITSIDTIENRWYSADAETLYLAAKLNPSAAYFMMVYWVPGQGGSSISTPFRFEFTTAPSFSGYNVSGSVSSSTGGVSPAYAFVGLSSNSVVNTEPHFIAGIVADGDGNFTIPHAPNGTFYPVAAKDFNSDGAIDPSTGDPVGITGPIVINNADFNGLFITISVGEPMTFLAAVDSAAQFAGSKLPGFVLKYVETWRADSLGRGVEGWEFYYYNSLKDSLYRVRPDNFGTAVEPLYMPWYQSKKHEKVLSNIAGAASPTVFVTNVEAAGGLAFRNQSVPDTLIFRRTLHLGQLSHEEQMWPISDTSQLYWGARYQFDRQYTRDSIQTIIAKYFVGDYATGNILAVTGVEGNETLAKPVRYSLDQNFPNPFNPSTTISYQLSNVSFVTLKVYDMLGREVATLANGIRPVGSFSVTWDALGIASGVYFYRLSAASTVNPAVSFTQVKKMALLR